MLAGAGFQPGLRQGTQAPGFELPVFKRESKILSLVEVNREKPVLLVFWASWCPACVEEIDLLNAWYRRYDSRGLQILAINVKEGPEEIHTLIEERPIRYTVLLDQKGEVAQQYGLVGLPTTVLLAKGGKILYYGFSLPEKAVNQLMEKGS